MSTTDGEQGLTVREAAQHVHRAEETIRRWIWTGKLPAHKRGHGYRVHEKDLDAIVAGAPLSRKHDLSLGEWVATVRAWRADITVSPLGGAGQLVIEDRAERSGLHDR